MSDGYRDDAQLLEAWRLGDQAAGDALDERHYRRVALFFHNKVSEAAQAELIRETFQACLKAADQLRGPAQFRTFLLGSANRVLARYLEQNERRLPSAQVDLARSPVSALAVSPVASIAAGEEQRELLEALRGVPLRSQVVLELYYWEELTEAEIGEVLGVSLEEARAQLREGRRHLEERRRQVGR